VNAVAYIALIRSHTINKVVNLRGQLLCPIATAYNRLEATPQGLSDRLIVLRVRLSAKRHATLISAYAPTMSYSHEAKESFYEELANATRAVPRNDKLILLGDFNARVRRDSSAWPGVLGRHGIGKDNANGTLLLLH